MLINYSRSITACFTGHRKINHFDLPERLDILLPQFVVKYGYQYFMAGGALGFDTIAAQAVLRLRQNYPHTELILLLPCKNHSKNWRIEDIALCEEIRQRADNVVYVNEQYHKGCFHLRNRMLVDCSNLCIAYMYRTTGGAAYTVDYSRKQGVEVLSILKENKKQL